MQYPGPDQGGVAEGTAPPAEDALALPGAAVRLLAETFTLQDGILIGYLLFMSGLVWRTGAGAAQESCARQLYVCVALVALGCFAYRASNAVPARLRSVIYRACIAGIIIYDYLMLRELLPLIRPEILDGELMKLDVAIFGVEPSLWMERFNQRPIVEWFSFFYFSYYGVCLFYLVTVVWLYRLGRTTTEFAIGTLIVFCTGQIGYVAVPGYGPVRYLNDQFAGPVNGGFFWGCVWSTVQAGSAFKDIFPSLHTAVPTWFTLFALEQSKRDRRWIVPTVVTGFFAANIIFSTMFLRWHYAVDVLAGLTLAFTAGFAAPRLAGREEAWRRRMGMPLPFSLAR